MENKKTEFSLGKVHELYFKQYLSYPAFRKLFLQNKDKFKNVEFIKFPRKTIYKIYDVDNFVETFKKLIKIEKI